MFKQTARASLLITLALPGAAQQSGQLSCLPSIMDSAHPFDCIPASTIPALGALLPLGPEFFVAPSGQVGLGTLNPGATLDVVGGVRGAECAFGNTASFGPIPNFDWIFDFTHTLDDFSAVQDWALLRAYLYLDPPIDQIGANAKSIYSHDLIVITKPGSDRHFDYIQGPYMLASHRGTGTVNSLAGALIGASNWQGHVESQGGAYMVSTAEGGATTTDNFGAESTTGVWGPGGSIVNDFSVYVHTPHTDGSLVNHYGLYLEDQDVGEQDSYAIYSAGGASYLAGDVGIGTDTPSAKLDVDGDFVASGTKSFVQAHPYDASKEIRFVCLEGNEAGTYFRGKARLVDGVAVIDVPEDFALVSEVDGLTVQVTPHGPGADLWVAERGLEQVVVRGARDVEFDYFVNGVRQGYAQFETIRDRGQGSSNASSGAMRSPARERVTELRMRRMRAEHGSEPQRQ